MRKPPYFESLVNFCKAAETAKRKIKIDKNEVSMELGKCVQAPEEKQ